MEQDHVPVELVKQLVDQLAADVREQVAIMQKQQRVSMHTAQTELLLSLFSAGVITAAQFTAARQSIDAKRDQLDRAFTELEKKY